jgi:membrane fusion protein, adhesin transport system
MQDIETNTPPLVNLNERIKPSTASNLLLWCILLLIVAFVVWATLTELDRSVRAQGRVIPSALLQTVSNLEGGVVDAILVKPGVAVKAGDPIIMLSPIQTSAELGSSAVATGALSAKVARLEAEITGRAPNYPAATDSAMAQQIEIERALHNARISDFNSANNAGNARIEQAQRSVTEARANYAARSAQRSSTQREVDMLRPLVERGIEPRMSLIQAEGQAAVAASETAAAQATIARAQAGIAEAQASLAQFRQDWRSKAGTELASARAELSARQSTTTALADRVARTVVRAPLSGLVNRVLVSTVGGSVKPGEPLVEIVPSEKGLLVEARVSTKDIAFVRIAQEAKVDVTAYDSAIYGSLTGQVMSISPDALVEERTGESFYVVRVLTSKNALIDKRGVKLPIGAGMTTNVSLLGEKRSVMSYILTPITRLGEKALRE